MGLIFNKFYITVCNNLQLNYYRIFSNLGETYSSGVYAIAKTACGTQYAIPYNQDFESFNSLMDCWSQEPVTGNLTWKSTGGSGSTNSPYAFTGENYSIFSGNGQPNQTTKLVTQLFSLEPNNEYYISFAHFQSRVFNVQAYLKVYYKNSVNGNWILLKEFPDLLSEWTISEINLPNPSSDYLIAFEGIANGITSVGIDNFNVNNGTVIGIENSDFEAIVYPNPSNGNFVVKGENIKSVSVYDLSGKIIFENNLSSNIYQINLSNIEAGMYMVKIVNENKIYYEKIWLYLNILFVK